MANITNITNRFYNNNKKTYVQKSDTMFLFLCIYYGNTMLFWTCAIRVYFDFACTPEQAHCG